MVFAGRGVEFNINLINNKTPQPENYYTPLTDQVEASDPSIETICVATDSVRYKKIGENIVAATHARAPTQTMSTPIADTPPPL